MEFKPFRIEDKARIDSYFAVHHYEQIDCTFNTLFLWQDAYQTSWAEQDGILFVRAGTGKDTFFMPPFAKEEENFVHGLALIHEEYDKLTAFPLEVRLFLGDRADRTSRAGQI